MVVQVEQRMEIEELKNDKASMEEWERMQMKVTTRAPFFIEVDLKRANVIFLPFGQIDQLINFTSESVASF